MKKLLVIFSLACGSASGASLIVDGQPVHLHAIPGGLSYAEQPVFVPPAQIAPDAQCTKISSPSVSYGQWTCRMPDGRVATYTTHGVPGLYSGTLN